MLRRQNGKLIRQLKSRLLIPLVVLAASAAPAQNKSQKQAPKVMQESKPTKVNVFVQSWDAGEIKNCSTYSNQPYLLICDDKSFLEVLGNAAANGALSRKASTMTKEQSEADSYHQAFLYAVTHSKEFLVRFSDAPWPKQATSAQKLTLWECTKDKEIICKFPGREK